MTDTAVAQETAQAEATSTENATRNAETATENAADTSAEGLLTEQTEQTAEETPLQRAQRVASKKIAEKNQKRQEQQQSSQIQQQLEATKRDLTSKDAKIAELEQRLSTLSENPIERWMREGKTPEQVRKELELLSDPVARKLAEIEKKDKEREENAKKLYEQQQEAQRQAGLTANRKAAEAGLVRLVEDNPTKYPFLQDLPSRSVVAIGYDLVAEYVEERQAKGDRRTREEIAMQDFSDKNADARILLAINRRIQERAEARKAKQVRADSEEAPSQESPTPKGGSKQPPAKSQSSSKQPVKAKATNGKIDLDKLDWDSLSDKEQFAIIGADVAARGGLKTVPKPTR